MIPALGLVNLSSVGLSAADLVVVSVLVVCVVCQAWCLKTMRTSLAALPALDERVARLTRSVALLVDTRNAVPAGELGPSTTLIRA